MQTLGCKPHICAAKTQDGATEYAIELRAPNMQSYKSCRVADEDGQESFATTHELCRKVDLWWRPADDTFHANNALTMIEGSNENLVEEGGRPIGKTSTSLIRKVYETRTQLAKELFLAKDIANLRSICGVQNFEDAIWIRHGANAKFVCWPR